MKKTTIQVTIIENAEQWIKDNILNHSLDSACCVYPTLIDETDFHIDLFD